MSVIKLSPALAKLSAIEFRQGKFVLPGPAVQTKEIGLH
jgi:hypothetical protein